MRMLKLVLTAALFLSLNGCAATYVALSKKDLAVQTKMSDSVFLDIESSAARTVFVDVKNTTDKDINIKYLIENQLQGKGYALETTPNKAGYILQVNVLQVGQIDPTAYEKTMGSGFAGFGGAVAGGATGAALGAVIGSATAGAGTSALIGLGVGSLAGGAIDFVSGALVKDVTYTIITDVIISEKMNKSARELRHASLKTGRGNSVHQLFDKKTDRMRYGTRIGSSANKVNLKFEEAQPALEEGLAKSIAGIF